MDPSFSASTRTAALAAMASETLDVLVVGGGITGAGVARDAAMRGLRTALVDAGDFGGGTSSRSSRLVHGGIRYLEHGWLGLVFEASRERRTLLRIAPHLVRPRPFTFPVHRASRHRRWQIWAGVLLYDALSLFRNVRRAELLGRAGVLRREPLLREHDLVGGAVYWDAQCDDMRLTLANVRAAASHGAHCANYARVVAFEKAAGRIHGAQVEDLLTGARAAVRAHVVVNATGPWCDAVRRMDDPAARALLRPTKGTHVAVSAARLGNRGAVTLTSPVDGRVIFVLPWNDLAVVGTTDTDSSESPDAVAPSRDDVVYLLRSANAVFPSARLQLSDVVSAWAGLRPLLDRGRRSPSAVPREHRVELSASGLVTIAGGKLTTYRVMAAEAVDGVVARLRALDRRPAPPRARTDSVHLPGGDVADVAPLVTDLAGDGLDERLATHLVLSYGSEAGAVVGLMRNDERLAERLAPPAPMVAAEVVVQARREMATSVADVLVRRTGLLHRDPDGAIRAAPSVAGLLADELGWSPERARVSVERFRDEAERMLASFRPEP